MNLALSYHFSFLLACNVLWLYFAFVVKSRLATYFCDKRNYDLGIWECQDSEYTVQWILQTSAPFDESFPYLALELFSHSDFFLNLGGLDFCGSRQMLSERQMKYLYQWSNFGWLKDGVQTSIRHLA